MGLKIKEVSKKKIVLSKKWLFTFHFFFAKLLIYLSLQCSCHKFYVYSPSVWSAYWHNIEISFKMSHLQAQWGFRKPRNICLCEKGLWPLKLVKKSLVLALPPKSATSYEKNCSGRWRHMWMASLAFWHKNHLSRHSLNFLFLYIRCSFFGTELLLIDEIGFCIWYVERQESWWSPD